MAKPTVPVIHPARFSAHNVQMPNPSPVYRYPKANLLTLMQKQGVAYDLLLNDIKPRHIRKCLGISNRQLKKAKQNA